MAQMSMNRHPRRFKLVATAVALAVLGGVPAVAGADTTTVPTTTIKGATGTSSWAPGNVPITAVAMPADSSEHIAGTYCQVDGGAPISTESAQLRFAVTGDGVHLIDCYSQDTTAGQSATVWDTVQIDSQKPTVQFTGSNLAPVWNSLPQAITATASEATQLSGVASIDCDNGSGTYITSTGDLASVAVTATGQWDVRCFATSGAGVVGDVVNERIWEDNSEPTIAVSGAPDPNKYYNTGQTVTLDMNAGSNPGAVLDQLSCSYDGLPVLPGGLTEQAPPAAGSWTTQVQLPGSTSGTLACSVTSTSGVTSAEATASELIDATPPTGVFVPDTADPARLTASISDGASGPASAQIEYQTPDGTWHTLPTTIQTDATDRSAKAIATIPNRLSLAAGQYPIRLLATDNAGNQGVLTTTNTGAPATLTEPTGAFLSIPYTVTSGTKTLLAKATGTRTVHLAYRSGAEISGQLFTDATALKSNLALTVIVTPVGTQDARTTHTTIHTSSDGSWSYQLPAGAARTVSISWPGSAALASASDTITADTAGSIHLTAKPASEYGNLTAEVTADGGGIPSAGVPVALFYSDKTSGAWHRLTTGTLTPNGTATLTATTPRIPGTIYLQARVATGHGWAYTRASANAATTVTTAGALHLTARPANEFGKVAVHVTATGGDMPLAGIPVDVYYSKKTNGGWHRLTAGKLGANGQVTLTAATPHVKPGKLHLNARIETAHGRAYPDATVNTTTMVTSAGELRLTAKPTIEHGKLTVNVNAAAAPGGTPVDIYYSQNANGGWHRLTAGKLGANGQVTLTTATPHVKPGKLHLNARIAADRWAYTRPTASASTTVAPPPAPATATITLRHETMTTGLWTLVGATINTHAGADKPVTFYYRTSRTSRWIAFGRHSTGSTGSVDHLGVPVPPGKAGQTIQIQARTGPLAGYPGGALSQIQNVKLSA